jgi:hypothetical protein
MFKRVMIGLFAMSVVAMWWTEATAGCRIIGGTRVCASYIPGSIALIFETEVISPPNPNRPIITEDWETKFEVWGRENCDDPKSLDPNCDLKGTLICRKGGSKKSTQHTIRAPEQILLPLRTIEDIDCILIQDGECLTTRTTIEVHVPCLGCDQKCKDKFGHHWTFHDFKDPEFNAVAAGCSDYDEDGSCPDQETEVFLVEQVEDFEEVTLDDEIYREDCIDGLCEPPPSPGVVSSFVLLASPGSSDAIVIGGGTHVSKGDVGTDGSFKTGSNVKIDGEGDAVNTSRIVATTTTLGGGSQFDAIYADMTSAGSNVKLGEPRAAYDIANVQAFAAGNLPDPEDWPSALTDDCTPGAASDDVITGSNTADFNIAVGSYDTITIGGGSTVSLTGGGIYQVREFITGSNVKIHVEQPTTICVTEKLTIGGGTRVNDPAFGTGNFVSGSDFVIEYTGTGTATTGSNVTFFGGILAFPNGALTFGGGGTYTGAYIAKSITTGSNVKLTLSDPSPF